MTKEFKNVATVEEKRKLNRPLWKIENYPVVWLHEISRDDKERNWVCKSCMHPQRGGVCLEVCVRFARRGVEKKADRDVGIKKYVCLPCAIKNLTYVLEEVQICNNIGPEAYDMMRKI